MGTLHDRFEHRLDHDSATGDVHALSASLSVGATYFLAQQELTGAGDLSAVGGEIGMRMHGQIEACRSAVVGALGPA